MAPTRKHLIPGTSHEVADPAAARAREEAEARLRSYYAEADEDERLLRSEQGRLEYQRTQEILGDRLSSASRIYDIGGGTGIHAAALAGVGHTVTLLDLVPAHVAAAAARGGFEALEGDARALPFADASADAALLAGPLYHLDSRADRRAALTEARRVLIPGGLVFAAAITRYAAFSNYLSTTQFALPLAPGQLDMLATGRLDPAEAMGSPAFPAGHFHTAAELAEELAGAGFVDVEVHGLEGPASSALEYVLPDNESLHGEMLRFARYASSDPHLVNLSGHLLAIGRVGS